MALSNKKIKAEIEKGDVIISPFTPENLNTSSYDVSLGQYYFREKKLSNVPFLNIYDKKHIEELWGEPKTAIKAKDYIGLKLNGIDAEDRIIVINPGETILAHTQEFIGGKNHITTMMKARSSLGRNFILVCKCAGWGDVGYFNRWTMEITNSSNHHPVALVVGRRIAQIVFFETGEILDNNYSQKGKYQDSEDLEKIQANWKPKSMLPLTYKDREARAD